MSVKTISAHIQSIGEIAHTFLLKNSISLEAILSSPRNHL
jgi:hypothetical protein